MISVFLRSFFIFLIVMIFLFATKRTPFVIEKQKSFIQKCEEKGGIYIKAGSISKGYCLNPNVLLKVE